MEIPATPFWFKQRQCKAEPQGPGNVLKVSGPNLPEAFLGVSPEDGGWKATLRQSPDGQDVAATAPEFPTPKEAWEAAFELFRTHLIV